MWMSSDGQWKVETEPSRKGTSYVIYRWSQENGEWDREGHAPEITKIIQVFGTGDLTRVEIPDEIPEIWPSRH